MSNDSSSCSAVAPPLRIHRARYERSRRWVVLLGLPLLLMALLWTSLQNVPGVHAAANDVYVGCADGSLLPSYGTIQDAVDDAIPGTVINICPGIYLENVALSDMNGGDEGDITLRRTPGMTGTVLISTTTFNSSIWIEPYDEAGDFEGSITIESIQTRSTEGYGIDFGIDGAYVVGNVVISDVQASGNAEGGVHIHATQDITVVNSQFNQNGDTGLHIELEAAANLSIINVQANNNGIFAELDFARAGIWILGNPDNDIESCGETSINLENIQANENPSWGVYAFSFYSVGISNTEVISNAFGGIAALTTTDGCLPGSVTLSNSYAERNGWDTREKSETHYYTYPFQGRNGGFNLISDSGGDIQIDSETIAEANNNFGYCLANYENATGILIQDSLARQNSGDGFSIGSECEDYGITSLDANELTETERDSSRSHNTGSRNTGPNELGIAIAEIADTTLVIKNSTSISNTGTGFSIFDTDKAITITNITAEQNAVGVVLTSEQFEATSAGDITAAAPPPLTQAILQDSLIFGNSDYGILYNQPVFFDTSIGIAADITSTLLINSNIICENGQGLGAYQDEIELGSLAGDFQALEEFLLAIDARGNWWGDASGPTTSENPGGTGDSIDSASVNPTAAVNEVAVLFDPWIDTLHASAVSSPTLPGIPVTLQYQFRDELASYFLQNGVGDPNNGPLFSLAAINGVIDGDLNKFIVNSAINSSATPSAAGLMTVNLTGPCGLNSTLAVPVAVPSIAVSKSPDIQHILAGEVAFFDIWITNTGDITLTDITVNDPLVATCSASTGSLGNLAVGEGVNYSCQQATASSYVNTIDVEAYALLNTGPAGDPVTDSDTAQVVIVNPAISVEKSPDTQSVLSGDTAIFTITVRNEGDVILTNISVADPLAPNCVRATGALGNLAVGATASYTCTLVVNENLVNTVNVEGFALLDNGPATTSVTDSDTAQVVIVNPAISVEKSPDIQGIVRGETAIFTITVRNEGDVILTNISVADPLAPNCVRATGALGNLAVGATASYTCTLVVNDNLVNTVNVEGFALLDNGPSATPVTDSDTAQVFVASFELVKTVFVDGYRELIDGGNFNPSNCALESNIKVPINTTVKYCYTITNTGDYTLTAHSLVDSHIPGVILTNFAHELAPGETFSTVDAGISVTQTLAVTTTNVATWTATLADPVVEVTASAIDATLPVSVNAAATVRIAGPNDDTDGDTIPDNIEGTGDEDGDGIPNYLDPSTPTSLNPDEQPNQFGEGLFLPSVVR